MLGYTIIKADTIEAAIENTKTYPFLEVGGSLELSGLLEIPTQK